MINSLPFENVPTQRGTLKSTGFGFRSDKEEGISRRIRVKGQLGNRAAAAVNLGGLNPALYRPDSLSGCLGDCS